MAIKRNQKPVCESPELSLLVETASLCGVGVASRASADEAVPAKPVPGNPAAGCSPAETADWAPTEGAIDAGAAVPASGGFDGTVGVGRGWLAVAVGRAVADGGGAGGVGRGVDGGVGEAVGRGVGGGVGATVGIGVGLGDGWRLAWPGPAADTGAGASA
jgi:hypothetical protein